MIAVVVHRQSCDSRGPGGAPAGHLLAEQAGVAGAFRCGSGAERCTGVREEVVLALVCRHNTQNNPSAEVLSASDELDHAGAKVAIREPEWTGERTEP